MGMASEAPDCRAQETVTFEATWNAATNAETCFQVNRDDLTCSSGGDERRQVPNVLEGLHSYTIDEDDDASSWDSLGLGTVYSAICLSIYRQSLASQI